MHLLIEPSALKDARVTVPGDKSISHRALLLGSIAEGVTEIQGFLDGEDCLATLAAMRSLGVEIETEDANCIRVAGRGLRGLEAPEEELDLGNSGTAMRLIAGLLSGQAFQSVLTGDESLRSRPMARIILPLTRMGASIDSDNQRPPLSITGREQLTAIDYNLPIASAQVKSAILLAGLYADGVTCVREPALTRDHTERMLQSMGVVLDIEPKHICLAGRQKLQGSAIRVPGDLSSAAFLMLAALISDSAEILLCGIGVNPTRTGIIDILLSMGARISLENQRFYGAEPIADIRVKASKLQAVGVGADKVALAIDEFPALFVAAGAASGTSEFLGIGELRTKESDRIAAMTMGLRELGIQVEESRDSVRIHGGRLRGGTVSSFGDHRVAMSLAVAGSAAEGPVLIKNTESIATSFPGFAESLESLGVNLRLVGDGTP